MPKRRHTMRVHCTHPAGCVEAAIYEYDSIREMRRCRGPHHDTWRCTRHSKPEEVLSADSPERIARLECVEVDGNKFWRGEDGAGFMGGFKYGPGFKAYAKDFPEGAVLIVTAMVVNR